MTTDQRNVMKENDTRSTASSASGERVWGPVRTRIGIADKLSYAVRWLPAYAWQRLTRRPSGGKVHLIISLADHFEPAFVPEKTRPLLSMTPS